jgi:hypothetical protein
MYMGFIGHVLIGQLGRHEKRNAALLLQSFLHLRLTADLTWGQVIIHKRNGPNLARGQTVKQNF